LLASLTTATGGGGALPLAFEVNAGQTDSHVSFLSRGSGYTAFLTSGETVLSLNPTAPAQDDPAAAPAVPPPPAVLRVQLVGASVSSAATGLDGLASKSNYFVGSDASKWLTNIAQYGQVKYAGVYPGIDQIFSGNEGNLEYDFVVTPGADVSRIAMNFAGADQLAIDDSGNLTITIGSGTVVQHVPVIYQDNGGMRQVVSGHYVLRGGTQAGFEVGSYDTARPLIIDPVLTYSTYLGGSGTDEGFGVAVAGAEEVQTVTVSGSPGTFTLTFNGQPTSPLADNASAAVVQSALEGLPTIGSGNARVSMSGGVYTVTFVGTLAGANQNQMLSSP